MSNIKSLLLQILSEDNTDNLNLYEGDFDLDLLSEEIKSINFNDNVKENLKRTILLHGLHNKHNVKNPGKSAMKVYRNPENYEFHDVGHGITKITDKATGKIHMHI